MTRQICFDEIMEYHRDNQGFFEDLIKYSDTLVPFVGAGLSAFALYPLWRKFLENSFDRLDWSEKHNCFQKALNEHRYEETAAFLKEYRGKGNFLADISREFNSEKLNTPEVQETLNRQAVYLLPLLFDNLILTTNFDHVIEHFFLNNNSMLHKGHPGHFGMLNQALRQGTGPILYKFHGDVSEPSAIVLTTADYNKHYSKGSDLLKELSRCFKSKMMLFMGCSLHTDRTMSVLKKTLEPGTIHYAILPCAEENLRTRAKELGDQNIRAILYPKERHETVRIILEKLLESKKPEVFKMLPYHESIAASPPANRFEYKSGSTAFEGRGTETKAIIEFCETGSNNPGGQ